MRKTYAAAGAVLLLALMFYSNFTSRPMGRNLSVAINSTRAYLQQVNQSAYLFFYPNLGQAYSYLYRAMNQSLLNQSMAYALLNQSRGSAMAEQDRIGSYRQESAYVLGGITVALAVILYALMRPFNTRPSGRAGRNRE